MDGYSGGQSPMDFQWQTRAPGDPTSPFYKLSMQHEQNGKRPHSVFDSPTKSSTPGLREPNSQPFLFNQPATSNQPLFSKPAFQTPRKFNLDFSSGAEFSSPDNADTEDVGPDTPEPANRRNSLFNMYGRFAPSPGRGEIPKKSNYSNALARRVQKRRRRRDGDLDRLDRQRHKRSLDKEPSDDEDEVGHQVHRPNSNEDGPRDNLPLTQNTRLRYIMTLLQDYPQVPDVLSYYFQFVSNSIFVMFVLYLGYRAVSGVITQVNHQGQLEMDRLLSQANQCAAEFINNRCDHVPLAPALEKHCREWELCMNRDPTKIAHASLSARAFADIINNFTDAITYKTMFFLLLVLATLLFVSNYPFSHFRHVYERDHLAYPPHKQHFVSGPTLDYYPPKVENFNRSPSKNRHKRMKSEERKALSFRPRTPSPSGKQWT